MDCNFLTLVTARCKYKNKNQKAGTLDTFKMKQGVNTIFMII